MKCNWREARVYDKFQHFLGGDTKDVSIAERNATNIDYFNEI